MRERARERTIDTALSIEAIAVAVRSARYLPITELAETPELLPLARAYAASRGVEPHDVVVLDVRDDGEDRGDDVALRALTLLGSPARPEPLFLVCSGVLLDPSVAQLGRIVHHTGWAGEDVGISHLEELGGTMIFDMLPWAVPEDTGATVLVCDTPLLAEGIPDLRPTVAVGLRVCRGRGPLRVVDCGDTFGRTPPRMSEHVYSGARPAEPWLAMATALAAGRIADGDRILLHVDGPHREGWLAMAATDVAGLRLADADLSQRRLVPR